MFPKQTEHPRFFCYFLFERKSISYFELSRLLVRDNLKHFYSSLKLALHCVGIDIHLSHIALNRCACNELALLVVLLEHNATSLRQIDEHGVALCSFLYAECRTTFALEEQGFSSKQYIAPNISADSTLNARFSGLTGFTTNSRTAHQLFLSDCNLRMRT